MTLKDLYIRIKDTTGLGVLTVSDMYTLYQNAIADMSSRGYREFTVTEFINAELIDEGNPEHADLNGFTNTANMKYTMTLPSNVGKLVYVKMIDDMGREHKCNRINLTYSGINRVKTDEGVFTSFAQIPYFEQVYYTKHNTLVAEASDALASDVISVGHYRRLSGNIIPDVPDPYDQNVLSSVELDVRDQLIEALVFYGIYYVYNKYLKDEGATTRVYNQYKYFMEDLQFELAHEDSFLEEDYVIMTEVG